MSQPDNEMKETAADAFTQWWFTSPVKDSGKDRESARAGYLEATARAEERIKELMNQVKEKQIEIDAINSILSKALYDNSPNFPPKENEK